MGRKKVLDKFSENNLNQDYSKENGNHNQEDICKDKKSTKKNYLSKMIVNEFSYITNLFDVLDIDNLNQGRKKAVDEDDEDDLQLPNIPEKKIFKKTPSKKASTVKNKSYPHSIEKLEKELEELKGTPMSYQKQMRKKGLQVRLTKKKRKEDLRQQKAALKQGKKLSGPGKIIKPVLNSDGNVVSNKFDFADNEVKKEIKRKHTNVISEFKEENEKKKMKLSLSNSKVTDDLRPQIKTENGDITNFAEDSKANYHEGPIFNKENKMVFSKVYISDNKIKQKKKKKDKDPKRLLQKIREDSKKLSEIEKEDKEKAILIKEKQKWSTALKRASGEKVKDDPELLKKSVTKEKNKKLRSQKKWKARMDHEQSKKDEKQKKRKENIQARKLEVKKRKMKKAVKKGRFVQI